MSYIECEDLVIGYRGKVLYDSINLKVNKGDFLYIVGENGAGKSTIMKVLLQLLKPIEGKVSFGDEIESDEIGYLPQQTEIQINYKASVREIVLSGFLNKIGIRPFYSRRLKKAADKNMKELGIWDLRNDSFSELSSVDQQRVLLARALCSTKKILLLDEPLVGLDSTEKMEIHKLIEDLNNVGVTIIMTSNDMEEALKYATHILHITREGTLYTSKEEDLNSNKLLQQNTMEEL